MYALQTLTGLTTIFFSSSSSSHSRPFSISISRSHGIAAPFSRSVATRKIPTQLLKSQPMGNETLTTEEGSPDVNEELSDRADDDLCGGEEKDVSGIHVPRQKYISVSKAELLEGILSMFESKEDADEFARFSRCLDSLLHAEHKILLEEMRLYYSHNHLQAYKGSTTQVTKARQQQLAPDSSPWKMGINGQGIDKGDGRLGNRNFWDMKNIFDEFIGSESAMSNRMLRADVATSFQNAFLKLLRDAQFEEISAQDLLLTRALKTDYLLTLPIYVDWKRALESNAIIFRRGYSSERQKGLLIVEKLDYLQSKLLQELFFLLSKPSKTIGIWVNEALKHSSHIQKLTNWIEKAKIWLKNQYLVQNMASYVESRYSDQTENGQSAGDDALPIWLAAQRAVPRYEGLLSSVGPRERLMRRLLMRIGFIPFNLEISLEPDNDSTHSEAYLRPNFLPRITLSDIWKPATKESCEGNTWEMFKSSISILFGQSVLQEPAFQELILLYTDDGSQRKSGVQTEDPPLHLKIYERIPIPDLPVIFPHKKLSFRILDTIRLDIASILGLLAYFVNYKFETIISSPSAFLLDVIAISALIIYATRVALGYKQTWDRYQLLVNKTLYEKTLASGFGSVHFLLDASEQQKHKEAILAYGLLLHSKRRQLSCRESVKDACERFVFDKFAKKVEMPIDNALATLRRLNIVKEVPSEEAPKLEPLPSLEAYEALKHRWNNLVG